MRISDWSSDVCSSDLEGAIGHSSYPLGSPRTSAALASPVTFTVPPPPAGPASGARRVRRLLRHRRSPCGRHGTSCRAETLGLTRHPSLEGAGQKAAIDAAADETSGRPWVTVRA